MLFDLDDFFNKDGPYKHLKWARVVIVDEQ